MADFEPSEFVDTYEVAVVELLKKKQAGTFKKSKDAPRIARPSGGNVIDLLKRSLELEKKKPKTKAPSIAPALPKGKAKSRQRA